MFHVGGTRDAREILQDQNAKNDDNLEQLRKMRDMCDQGEEILRGKPEDLRDFGLLLNEAWQLKKGLSAKISPPLVDQLYDRAREAGAIGGKLLGAGGTGFLLLFVENDRQQKVRKALSGLIEQKVIFEPEGSRIIHVGT